MSDPGQNWIHLDLKGMMPGLNGLLRWLDWLADAGFDGVVFEYEDRLPWRALPGLHRPVLSMDEWRIVWAHCRRRDLRVAPLMQTQGHLEWVLMDQRFAHLREAGHWNELCPSHEETMPLLECWLDELIGYHPDSEFVHLGADETWHLATCPRCRAQADRLETGRLGVFLDHVGRLCRRVVSSGKRPMIWADMFWRTDTWNGDALPPETILVDWQYGGAGPWSSLDRLRGLNRPVWGASAIRSGFDAKYALAPLGMRLENVRGWNRLRAEGAVAHVLHTVWGRGDSLRPIYGPWEGWLPAFLAASNPEAWDRHPLSPLSEEVDRAMVAPEWSDSRPLIDRIEAFQAGDRLTRDCLSWWSLALQHRRLLHNAVEAVVGHAAYDAVALFRSVDPEKAEARRLSVAQWRREAMAWNAAADAWLTAQDYSDRAEYLASKSNGIKHCLGALQGDA